MVGAANKKEDARIQGNGKCIVGDSSISKSRIKHGVKSGDETGTGTAEGAEHVDVKLGLSRKRHDELRTVAIILVEESRWRCIGQYAGRQLQLLPTRFFLARVMNF